MCASLEGQLHIYSFPAFVSTFIRLYLCVYRVRVYLLYQDLVSIFAIFYLNSQKKSWEIWVRWSCIGVSGQRGCGRVVILSAYNVCVWAVI